MGQRPVDLGIGNPDPAAAIGRFDHLAPGHPGGDKIAIGLRLDPGPGQHLEEIFGAQIGAGGEFRHAAGHRLARDGNAKALRLPALQPVVDQRLFRHLAHVVLGAQKLHEPGALRDFIAGDGKAVDGDRRGEIARRLRLQRRGGAQRQPGRQNPSEKRGKMPHHSFRHPFVVSLRGPRASGPGFSADRPARSGCRPIRRQSPQARSTGRSRFRAPH